MKKIARPVVNICMLAMMLVSAFVPILKVYATEHGSGEYELGISIDYNADWVASITVDGEQWDADDKYRSVDNEFFITMELHVPNDKVRGTTSVRPGGNSGPFVIQQAGQDEDWQGTHRKFTYTISYEMPENVHIDHLSLNPYSEDNDGPNPDEGDTEAIVRVHGGEGSFDDSIYDENGDLIEERTVYYADNYHEASFTINRNWFRQPMPEDAVPETNYSELHINYFDDPDSEAITIGFATLWHMKFVDKITINNVDYDIPVDYGDQVSYLDHYGGQMVTFEIEVPKDANNFYDVVVKVGKNEQTWIGNFLWTSDPEQQWERDCHPDEETGEDVCEYILDKNGDKVPGRDYIGNSSLELLEVSYTVGDVYYHCSAREDNTICEWYPVDDPELGESCDPYDEEVECGIPYLEFNSRADENADYDDGALVVPAGATVTMRVIPDYGYQVLNVNMADLDVSDDGIGEFTFTVPGGAAYFVADVVPMEDTVNAMSDLVTEGSIDLGDGQTTLNHGSAQLNVSDVELDEETLAGFEDAAEGYNLKNFLEISLFNITCKGLEGCVGTDDDSWIEQIEDLNEPATITLQLEEGVDGNEIVIVHQKHDGTYEIIPTVYDPETQTLTFTTTSFSNYAIASRTVAPDTGTYSKDGSFVTMTVEMVAFVATVAVTGVIIKFVVKRNR